LTYYGALGVSGDKGENLSEVEIYVLVHGREVASVSRVRIAGMQENEHGFWEGLDNGLHMRRRRLCQRDVIVSETFRQISIT
jgi:hypothetical protein